jgi:hypothetical protein
MGRGHAGSWAGKGVPAALKDRPRMRPTGRRGVDLEKLAAQRDFDYSQVRCCTAAVPPFQCECAASAADEVGDRCTAVGAIRPGQVSQEQIVNMAYKTLVFDAFHRAKTDEHPS